VRTRNQCKKSDAVVLETVVMRKMLMLMLILIQIMIESAGGVQTKSTEVHKRYEYPLIELFAVAETETEAETEAEVDKSGLVVTMVVGMVIMRLLTKRLDLTA
jgi:hypothetical protein